MYVELHARSAFSFLAGASLPEELVAACVSRGMPALALLDRDNVSGIVRFHKEAINRGVSAHIGAEITLEDGSKLPLLAESRQGYQNLCRLISRIKLRAPKGSAAARSEDLSDYSAGLICLTGDEHGPLAKALTDGTDRARARLDELARIYGRQNVFVELQRHFDRLEEARNQESIALAQSLKLPIVATNGVCYATPDARELFDVLTCVKHKVQIREAGRLLARNAERFIKNEAQMMRLFKDLPEAIANTCEISSRLNYTLANLGYEFPRYPVSSGDTSDSFLRRLALEGAQRRYGRYEGRVRRQIEHELALIQKLGLAGYFLVVWEIVQFCCQTGIRVQGRGSAANSAVCYALGITAVDPIAMELLFERFLSEERGEWPDIDLDLPSGDQRERVIQHVYERYGQRGAAMTANVITYRGRSAIRDIGKVLGFEEGELSKLSNLISTFEWVSPDDRAEKRFRDAGLSLADPLTAKFLELYTRIQDLPRHLGQHSGGMVICDGALDAVVPLEPATMPGRVVIQWDKEDCADMGIVKVDLLGLGMMAVISDTIDLVREYHGKDVDLAHLPPDDQEVYSALKKGDTVGWFQVESRAQMSCLPRTQPARFYDLVVQVAIIRPGPIVGQMASPYIRRRQGKEAPKPLHPSLEPILARTLGVPLFQEQLMRMAMTVANFTGGEAEELRRACGAKRSRGAMQKIEEKLRHGMIANGISEDIQDRIVRSVTSFAQYGFPESHAASFALLAYASGYLKTHYLAAFMAAMLNNQPLGFYAPGVLVKDAQRHGLHFLPVDIHRSQWECTLENINGTPTLRLGFNYVKGLRRHSAAALIAERERSPFRSIQDLWARVPELEKDELRKLSALGALNKVNTDNDMHRRDALWDTELAVRPAGDLLNNIEDAHSPSPLAQMSDIERLNTDLRITGMTIGKHPMTFVREELTREGVTPLIRLKSFGNGTLIKIAGIVICRQRPGTARGVTFLSLEDETGIANVVLMPDLFERLRVTIVSSPALIVTGILQNLEGTLSVRTLSAERLRMLSRPTKSHDFY
jgi:error-prone DNA polymerase